MGMCVLVLGASGSGKSTSMRNFAPEEIGVLNVAGKPLPFRSSLPVANNAKYDTITKALTNPTKPSYVIDDADYLLAFDNFARASVKGYDKYVEMAVNFYNTLRIAAERTPEDCIVYFMMHEDEDSTTGRIKPKTIGRMLDEKLNVEGLFTVVLRTAVTSDGESMSYKFETQSNGFTPCKSPIGMLPPTMDNDLKAVDTAIREYYKWEKPLTNLDQKTTRREKNHETH